MLNLQSILFKPLRYEIPHWIKRRSWGFRVGLFLASAHLLVFVLNVLDMVRLHDGRWHMFWIVCGYIDFPVSLLLTKVILPLLFHGGPFHDPFMSRYLLTRMVFIMFYSIVGTGWYFLLPILIEKAVKRTAITALTVTASAAVMVIPIFAHWLQLLRFIAHSAKCFAPGLNSILPAIWTVLLVWLCFATTKRKAAMCLLLLAPFVFYYFLHDLYYYTILLNRHGL
jgi:hypothetical protein